MYIYPPSIGKDNQRFFLLHLLFYTGYIYGLLVKNPLFFTLYRVYLLATHFSIFYKFDVYHSSLFPTRRYNSKRTFKTAEQWTGLFRQKCIYVMKINIRINSARVTNKSCPPCSSELTAKVSAALYFYAMAWWDSSHQITLFESFRFSANCMNLWDNFRI